MLGVGNKESCIEREPASVPGLVLICTYNERENLPQLIAGIRSCLPTTPVLVVDDRSPDGTGAWVKAISETDPHIYLLEREGKLGLGSAIRDGLHFGLEHGFHSILNLDADLSHDPERIPEMVSVFCEHRADLVIGSRYAPGGQWLHCGWRRKLVSRVANLGARIFLRLPIGDCSSAYRLYRSDSLKTIPWERLRCRGYGFLEEILWWMVDQGAEVREVPIAYRERIRGSSKISLSEFLGTLSVFGRLARKAWSRMEGTERRKTTSKR